MIGAVDASFVAQTAAAPAAEWKRLRQEHDSAEAKAIKQRLIDHFKARDTEVRAHEAAHMSVGGSLVHGAASFSYETGPDGKRYAVGGEVSIDISAGRNPAETERKAAQIRSAALAPANPSSQDINVAAQASRMAAEAAAELSAQAREAAKKQAAANDGGAIKAYESAAAAFEAVAGSLISAHA